MKAYLKVLLLSIYSFNASFGSSYADLYKIKTAIGKPKVSHYSPFENQFSNKFEAV